MHGQVAKRLDVGLLPALRTGPLDGQHVVREHIPKHQVGQVRFGLLVLRELNDHVSSLGGQHRTAEVWRNVC